ncbi:hypothetical protein ABT093_37935 [Kitasatospora sp. NPDC002551]|uniref:hypothetical protein n=1 Tax=Kitasatospora sp. NPDC002551 TaxID=3154539 RepID=UPI00331EBC2A
MTTTPKPVADRAAVPSVPAGVPDTVTHAQMVAALRSLGLPVELITDVHLTLDTISFTVQVHDSKGRLLARDGGEVLTATTYIDVVADPRATGGTIRNVVSVDPDRGPDGCFMPPVRTPQVKVTVNPPSSSEFARQFLNSVMRS